jgi:GMP synthase-like glutamine amidotransferase
MATPPTTTDDRPGLVLQNEDDAPAALFDDWVRARGLTAHTVRVWEKGVPSDPREYGWIAALGAADSVTATEPAWIAAEVEFLRRAVEADVPVLGLCFGAQALSVALGGEISPASPAARGWIDIDTDAPDLVAAGPWLFFNNESFSIPERATALAQASCGPGAFALGPHLGVQFHPEVTPEIVEAWMRSPSEAAKLVELGIDPEAIRAQAAEQTPGAPERAFALFDAWREMATEPVRGG